MCIHWISASYNERKYILNQYRSCIYNISFVASALKQCFGRQEFCKKYPNKNTSCINIYLRNILPSNLNDMKYMFQTSDLRAENCRT